MSTFNYKEYIKNNPLKQKGTISESYQNHLQDLLSDYGQEEEIEQFISSINNDPDQDGYMDYGDDDFIEDFQNYIADKSLDEEGVSQHNPKRREKSNDEMSDDEREEFYMDLDDVTDEPLEEKEIDQHTPMKSPHSYKMSDDLSKKYKKLRSSNKIKVSELRKQLKEMIISELNENDEDYERMSREVEYGISPEGEDLEQELLNDLNEGYDSDGRTNAISVIDYYLEVAFEDGLNGKEFDRDLAKTLFANLVEFSDEFESPLNEAKEDEDEDVEIDDGNEEAGEEEDIEGFEDEGDIEENPGLEAGFSKEEKDIQDGLKQAYDQAVAVGDEKLADQIGNTITMFTRTHIVNR